MMCVFFRNNASISNFGGGFRWQSEYPWCIIGQNVDKFWLTFEAQILTKILAKIIHTAVRHIMYSRAVPTYPLFFLLNLEIYFINH
ncbi:Uncharacterized protein FWK35_00010178, partial [Aphis craccivora]